MRKLLLAFLLLPCIAFGQAANPQPDFPTAMSQAHPSLHLNFNDLTNSFKDSVSGATFHQLTIMGSSNPYPQSGTQGGNIIQFTTARTGVAGTMTLVSLIYPTAPAACTLKVVAGTLSGSNITITQSADVNVTATAGTQTFAISMPILAGQLLGAWAPAGCNLPTWSNGGSNGVYHLEVSTFPSGPTSYGYYGSDDVGVFGYIAVDSLATARQPGFDPRWPNNTSAEFPYNGDAGAPNTTLGDLEWSNPWSIAVTVDKVDFDKLTNTPLVLVSKGDTASSTGAYWALELSGKDEVGASYPLATRVCAVLQAPTPGIGGENVVTTNLCTAPNQDIINKAYAPYHIVLTNDGTGWTSAFHLYINGIEGGGAASNEFTMINKTGFDPVSLSVTGGTGYADWTSFTSTGGGVNCHVVGSMNSSAGIPSGSFSINPPDGRNSGCTSNPIIVLTDPTGTGAVITATALTSTLSTATTAPLFIGSAQGFSTDLNQAATNVDDFAIFPSALTQQQVSQMFNAIPWYYTILGAPKSPKPIVMADEDTGGDSDNEFTLAEMIGLARRGYIDLQGIATNDNSGSCPAMWRQSLNQAGLGHIPVGVRGAFASGGAGCTLSNVAAYNASTDTSSASYPSGINVYRTVLAANPTTPVKIFVGGDFKTLADFMQSPADGISSLTGAELLARDATNGGAIYRQGFIICTATAPPNPLPCSGSGGGSPNDWGWASQKYVIEHNGSMPIYFISFTPQLTGPGIESSRTSKDPFYMFLNSAGGFSRNGWDPLTFAMLATDKFTGGLQIAVSGGTGYADWTPLATTGGNAEGELQGWLRSSGGVPNAVTLPGGCLLPGGVCADPFSGLGNSWTSLPTITTPGAIGTGVVLTPYLNTVCGTMGISNSGTTWTETFSSATCSNHFAAPFTWNASLDREPNAFQWFINSLVNTQPVGRPR